MSTEAVPTADLIDRHGEELQSCCLQFQRFGRRNAMSGAIKTLRCHEDNALVRTLLSEAGHGRVLVVDGGGSLRTALLGDQLAELGRQNNWSGVIISGAIRDSAEIDRLDFAVKALGSNPRKSSKTGAGEVDVTVSFGEVDFVPGHWLASDEDGIVVAARELTSD